MNQKKTRFVIVGFDGLRPDSIRNDMPCVSAFIEKSHCWDHYMATFPTETYVNHPTIFSGFRPNRHGVIANAYFNRKVPTKDSVFRGNSVASIEAQDRVSDVIEVPTLGDRLGEAGKTLRVLCANSEGSTRLQHIHADHYPGHLNCCVHNISATLPIEERKALQTRWGNGVQLKFPDFDGTDLITDIFFNYELPRGLGDVTILWIGEPDHSCHEFGINDERTKQARRHADEAFKKIFTWWESDGKNNGVQLVVISDHGHGEVAAHYDLKQKLTENGWKVLTGSDLRNGGSVDTGDLVIVGDYTLGLWLNHPSEDNLIRLRDELMAIDEVGMIFSQPKPNAQTNEIEGMVPGTFSEALVFSDHERGPDLRVTMRNNPKTGKLIMGPSLEIGTGNHGGLLPQEINSVLAIQGDCFLAEKLRHSEPAGHDDFALTVMTMMGLMDKGVVAQPIPTARVLTEAIHNGDMNGTEEEILCLKEGYFQQYIRRVWFGDHVYVTEGARDGECTIIALEKTE